MRTRRITGHALRMEWSGEYGENSSSTGYCKCGWEESASSQHEVRNEYHWHMERVWEKKMKEQVTWVKTVRGRRMYTSAHHRISWHGKTQFIDAHWALWLLDDDGHAKQWLGDFRTLAAAKIAATNKEQAK